MHKQKITHTQFNNYIAVVGNFQCLDVIIGH